MARPRRPAWQVEEVKGSIFAAALALFNRHGYEAVSIRKIACRAGCSPATIYNYYRDKDALYIEILKRGFAILLDLLKAEPRHFDPVETIRRYARVYYRFSLEHPYYYDLMFSDKVPKYLDYVGTQTERAARREKAVALRSFRLLTHAVRAAFPPSATRQGGVPAARAVRALFSLCHGMISLHRSGIWAELDTDFGELYFAAVDHFLRACQ
jgi:AcrR family transcriptional regulator